MIDPLCSRGVCAKVGGSMVVVGFCLRCDIADEIRECENILITFYGAPGWNMNETGWMDG